jgi:hypothetical protein
MIIAAPQEKGKPPKGFVQGLFQTAVQAGCFPRYPDGLAAVVEAGTSPHSNPDSWRRPGDPDRLLAAVVLGFQGDVSAE